MGGDIVFIKERICYYQEFVWKGLFAMPIYLALITDSFLGDPKGFPHPIILVGKLIKFYEKIFYPASATVPSKDRKTAGVLFTLAVLGTVGGVITLLLWLLSRWPLIQAVFCVYLLYTSLAWKSLKVETGYVIDALKAENLPKARRMLSYVVGRDTQELTPRQIIKATVETIAENTVDGVLAPLFYMCCGYFIGGTTGAVLGAYLYKSVNTMDSMVGYKNERYLDFGCCAARLDDVANFIPARLGAMLMLLAGGLLNYNLRGGWQVWLRDRYAHKSPNSAQSESVAAGLLGIQLGGPAYYFGELVDKPTIGRAIRHPELGDYDKTCRILDWSVLLAALLFGFFHLGSIVL